MTTKIEAVRGDSIPFTVDTIIDQAGDAVSDLSGWKCFFTLKSTVQDADADALVSRTTNDASISVVGSAFTWEISADESDDLPEGVPLAWDVRMRSPGGEVMTPLRGTLTLSIGIGETTT